MKTRRVLLVVVGMFYLYCHVGADLAPVPAPAAALASALALAPAAALALAAAPSFALAFAPTLVSAVAPAFAPALARMHPLNSRFQRSGVISGGFRGKCVYF